MAAPVSLVLLRSADEQEFKVERDVALQSALIKNILEGRAVPRTSVREAVPG
jgi:hypothetical protein